MGWLESWMNLAAALAGVACATSAYLLVKSYSSEALPGCGAGGGCNAVLSSRWAKIGKVPVAGLGMGLYLAMLAVLLAKLDGTWSTVLGAAAVGGAIWFVGVQVVAIKRVCPYCVLAHVCGAAAGGLVLGMGQRSSGAIAGGAGLVAMLIVAQFVWPNKTFRVEEDESDDVVPSVAPAPAKPELGRRSVSFYNGKFVLNTDEWPMIGPANARFVLAKMFDYTCEDCRHLHDLLGQLKGELRNQMAILYVPVPLEADCNPAIWPPDLRHVNACHYARYALAVWMAAPGQFAEFDHWMHEGKTVPSVMAARARAAQLVGAGAFSRALADSMLPPMLNRGIELWKSVGMKRLPNVALPGAVLFGRVPGVKDLEEVLTKQLLSAPQPSSVQ
jgi:uncharacterized membrane protein